tara:strand:+ start:1123 stop:1818 length:696 start_codon:yes stop_codon:yes gene_type:complete
MAKTGKQLAKVGSSILAIPGQTLKSLKKTATVKQAKSYSKVALTLGTAGLGYAALQETGKGITRAFASDATAADLEWRFSNTELGLAAQTLLLVGATNIAATQLKGVGLLKRNEALMAANAGMGLAVGRHLLGTSLFNIGKRFEYLLDGDVGSALYPGPGPAITLPSNAAAAAQVVTHNVASDAFTVRNNFLENRVDRGMPYKESGTIEYRKGPVTESVEPRNNGSFTPWM